MKNVIKTKRLWLRPLEASDAEALSPAINDFEVSKWLAVVPFPYRLEDARSFIAGALNGKKVWAIIYEGRLVGVISIQRELGYWLARPVWGQGIMREAAEAVVSEYFDTQCHENLGSGHFVGNEKSKRILKALGFEPVGEVTKVHSLAQNKELAHKKMNLTRAAWEKRDNAAVKVTQKPVRFTSERLEFRTFLDCDLEAVVDVMSIYDVTKNTLTWRFPPEKAQVMERMSRNDKQGIALCIFEKGTLIGIAGLASGGLWYLLHPAHWANGFGTEVTKAMVNCAFHRFDWPCLEAGVFSDNPASVGVLQKIGAYEIQPIALWPLARKTSVKCRAFVIPRSDWEQNVAPVIKTARFIIRSLSITDLNDFARIGGDARVAPMILRATSPWPLQDAAVMLMQSAFTGRPGYRLGVYDEKDRLIGCLGLGPNASIAYFFDPDIWGHGVATEAVSAFVKDCFERYEFQSLFADRFHDNPASGRVLNKVGFEETGKGIGTSAARPEAGEIVEYTLTRAVFEQRCDDTKA